VNRIGEAHPNGWRRARRREVLVGLLDLAPQSVRPAPDDWTPTASLIDLLTASEPVVA